MIVLARRDRAIVELDSEVGLLGDLHFGSFVVLDDDDRLNLGINIKKP